MTKILASAILAAPAPAPAPTPTPAPTPAPAVTGTQIAVTVTADGKGKCEATPVTGTPGVSVKLSSAFTGKEYRVKIAGVEGFQTVKPGDSLTLKLPAGEASVTVAIEDEANKLVCEQKDVKVSADPAGGTGAAGAKSGAEPYDPEVGKIVADARAWLKAPVLTGPDRREGIGKHKVEGKGHRRTVTIYHTPDGVPVYPVPHDLEETDTIVLVVVVPRTGAARLTARTCPKLKLGRVRGSWAESSEGIGLLSSGRDKAKEDRVSEWELITVGEFRCSEQLDYTIETHFPAPGKSKVLTASHAETVSLDPVYFFTVGVALAFDVGRPTTVSLLERPTMGMTGSEKYVASARDFGGLTPLITVGAHPCGANPKRWRACDMFTPTLAFDPTRLTRGVGFGVNFSFTPWFGVLLAVNLYKSRVLQPDSKIAVGDVWTTAGDLPTKEVFNAQSVGAFVGINLTSDIIQAIRGKAKQ